MKIMASDPITSWEIDGETVSDFIFLGSNSGPTTNQLCMFKHLLCARQCAKCFVCIVSVNYQRTQRG